MPESNSMTFFEDLQFCRALAANNGGRLPIFPSPSAAERAGRWFSAATLENPRDTKYCEAHRGLELRAAGGSSNTAGGYLVPIEVETAIIAFRDLAGVFRRRADVRQMGSDVRNVVRRTGGITGQFVGENSAIPDADASWGIVSLRAKKIAALTKISTEMDEDSLPDLGEYFVQELGNAFALLEDDCGFNGDGTSTYGGIRGICTQLLDGTHNAGKVTATSGHDTFDELDASDVAGLMAALPEAAWANARFYVSSYGAARCFARLGATAGGNIMTAAGPRPGLSYLGFPVELTPKLPGSGSQQAKPMILIGDLSIAATLGSRRQITVRRATQRYFEFDQIAVRATERFDIVCHDLGDGTTAGAVVGLVGG